MAHLPTGIVILHSCCTTDGGGFVSDDDRVSLQSLLFATPSSRGASETRHSLGKFASPPLRPSSAGGPTPTPTLGATDAYFEATPRFALRAGPRATIYFQPQTTRIALLCSGGLCPGLNDVIRALVLKALDYGMPEKNILGIKHGFRGFYSKAKNDRHITLTRQAVEDIHLEGGSVLGTSECGECDVLGVVKRLDLWAVDMLFVKQCDQLNVPCSVIALPKSIDNDFLLLDKTFGFETAVEEAQKAILAAKCEASSAYRGIGLVKLMGRTAGFIAVKAALASGIVDVVLVPEVPFNIDSMVAHVEHILQTRGHAVVCMAEGAAKDRVPDQCYYEPGKDAATCIETDPGNWLKQEMKKRLRDVDINVYSKLIAHGAVHAGFAGYTACAVGQVNTHMVYLPLQVLAQAPRQMDPNGELWNRLKAAIGQPSFT
ncbi:hypothetical protein COHA_001900 [Chlorella ohadii]|uniref:Phosphofructokinase domain-containing protein n=1 Tax=Chlorella ohadii TaxID=2649997 RepID=A0AAD5DVQ2_9CHLO|nr:hypothetical protein COHA_001900 [Chlorella ohadii]